MKSLWTYFLVPLCSCSFLSFPRFWSGFLSKETWLSFPSLKNHSVLRKTSRWSFHRDCCHLFTQDRHPHPYLLHVSSSTWEALKGEHRDGKTGAQHYLIIHTCSLGKSVLFLPGEKEVTPGWSELCFPGKGIPVLDLPSGKCLVSPSLGCKRTNCKHQAC